MVKFCVKCGVKIEQEQKFCPKCGYTLSARQNKDVEQNIEKTQSKSNTEFKNNNKIITEPKPVRNKLVLSMGAKVSIIGMSIIVVLAIIFFIIGNSLAKPSKVVSRFEQAIASENKSELTKLLYCDDKRLEINEKSISPLLNYFKDNSSYLNTVVKGLNNDAFNLENTSNLSKSNDKDSSNMVSLVYTGKKFLLFPSYKVAIKPMFIQVNTSIKDVVFSLNGIEVGKSDKDKYSKEFGPFIPGKYEFLGSYKGTFVILNEPYDIDFIKENKGKVNLDVLTKLNYIKVRSDYEEAELFVNGKETGVKIKDAKNFGPLSKDTKVYATLVEDGKTLKSNEYKVYEGDEELYISFEVAKNEIKNKQNEVKDLVYWYTRNFSDAVNMNNFSYVEDYIYPGSKLYNEQKTYIPNTYAKGIKEKVLSLNVTSCKLSDDNKSGVVTTEEVYSIDNKGESSVKTFKYKYTFKYNEAKKRYQLETIEDNNSN